MKDNANTTDKLLAYESEAHKRNLKRIRYGIWCFIIIPLLFLFLLFLTNSNKVIFLILWIVSLFSISIYLIAVEYSDYKLSRKINYFLGNDDEPISLLESGLDDLEEVVKELKEKRKEDLDDGEDS